MKIAAKVSLTAVTALVGLGMGLAHVSAQDNLLPQTQQTAAQDDVSSSIPGPSGLTGEAAIADSIRVDSQESVPSVQAVTFTQPAQFTGTVDEDDHDILTAKPEIPDSVKSVVKRLNHATKDITLEDLNAAREAVIKLDVLIDIEKRLNDLVSLRREREDSVDSFSAALPASALAPPENMGHAVMPVMPSQAAAAPMPLPVAEVEVLRISGASGNYAALVKDGDGAERLVKTGDTLADGGKIQGISRHGVTIRAAGKTRTIQVKDVTTVFSNR